MKTGTLGSESIDPRAHRLLPDKQGSVFGELKAPLAESARVSGPTSSRPSSTLLQALWLPCGPLNLSMIRAYR